MELVYVPPGSLGNGETFPPSTWTPLASAAERHLVNKVYFAVPEEACATSDLDKIRELDKFPPRKRLVQFNDNSFELSPFPHGRERMVANRMHRAFGPDGHMTYDMAKLCAYLVKAKQAECVHRRMLSLNLPRPMTYKDQFRVDSVQRHFERGRNDFLSECCYHACHSDVVPVRPDEIALWDEWSTVISKDEIRRQPEIYVKFRVRKSRFQSLREWCHTIPDLTEKFDAFRTLAAFSSCGYVCTTTYRCSVCEFWNPKVKERSTCEDIWKLPVHVCHMGEMEYRHRLELLKLTAKFCQRQAKAAKLWPRL
ncbi:hypothetical protein DICA0_D11980 [Diutina catenulata]